MYEFLTDFFANVMKPAWNNVTSGNFLEIIQGVFQCLFIPVALIVEAISKIVTLFQSLYIFLFVY